MALPNQSSSSMCNLHHSLSHPILLHKSFRATAPSRQEFWAASADATPRRKQRLRSCPFRVWHAVGIGDQGRRSGGLWGCPCCAHPARRAASGSPAGSVRSGCGVSSMSLGGGGCAPPSVSETLNPVVHGLHLSPSPLPPPRCRPRICAARCPPRIPIPPKKTKKRKPGWVTVTTGHRVTGSPCPTQVFLLKFTGVNTPVNITWSTYAHTHTRL
jgi:hypothetical protein